MELPKSLRPSSCRASTRRKMERMSSNYCIRYRAETITEIGTARRLVLARLTLETTMGHGESQIGYLANDIKFRGGNSPLPALTHRRRVLPGTLKITGAGEIATRECRPSKFNDHPIAHPTRIELLPLIRGSLTTFS
jgi:hypothetical protein